MYEVDDLVFDPTILMINFGILDDAFEIGFKSVADFYKLCVEPFKKSKSIKWKKSWENKPICRQAIAAVNGIQTDRSMPLRYPTFLCYLQRLGMMAGFPEIFNPYNIRRGTGEGVQARGTQGQLQQVMSHKDAGIFQAYINVRVQCDVQAAFLGRPSNDAMIKSISHMSRNIDPRAPTRLTECEINDLKLHPFIVELRQRRDALSKEARRQHKTLKIAQELGTDEYNMYRAAQDDLERVKAALRRTTLKESRSDFFDRIDTEDARRQLRSLALDLKEELWSPVKKIDHTPERRSVIELLCNQPSDLAQQGKTRHRILAIDALVSLCQQQKELRPKYIPRHRDWGILPSLESSSTEPNHVEGHSIQSSKLHPLQVSNNKCIFCLSMGQGKPFCRPRKAREHVEHQHLRFFRDDDLVSCPDPYCRLSGIVLYGVIHFKNHVAKIHGCTLSPCRL